MNVTYYWARASPFHWPEAYIYFYPTFSIVQRDWPGIVREPETVLQKVQKFENADYSDRQGSQEEVSSLGDSRKARDLSRRRARSPLRRQKIERRVCLDAGFL